MAESQYQRVNLHRLTGRTAPPRVRLTFDQRNSAQVRVRGAVLLLGPMRIEYRLERSTADGIFLSRWDVPSDEPSRRVAVA